MFLGSPKLYVDFKLFRGSAPLTPKLFKGQLYIFHCFVRHQIVCRHWGYQVFKLCLYYAKEQMEIDVFIKLKFIWADQVRNYLKLPLVISFAKIFFVVNLCYTEWRKMFFFLQISKESFWRYFVRRVSSFICVNTTFCPHIYYNLADKIWNL